MDLAHSANISRFSSLAPIYNPSFSYQLNSQNHTVWFLDASTAFNQARSALLAGTAGIALYRLGLEDPHTWLALQLASESLHQPLPPSPPTSFSCIPSNSTFANQGHGVLLSLDPSHSDGYYHPSFSDEGLLTFTYTSPPNFPTLFHSDSSQQDLVALTFDDGPDPEFTPQILSILRQFNVKATFFLIGSNAAKYPHIVQQIVRNGHEIANHTYFHSNLATLPDNLIRFELNATRVLLEDLTGFSPVLFRPPYDSGDQPSSTADFSFLPTAQKLGFLTVSHNLDSADWHAKSPEQILAKIKEDRQFGNVILLHDAGGDRSNTIAALPLIIQYLQNRGDSIVPLSTILGLSRNSIMPPVPKNSLPISHTVSSAGLLSIHFFQILFQSLLILSTSLLILRWLFLLSITLYRKFCPSHSTSNTLHPYNLPPISILIAAYNEEKVIRSTLLSILKSDYPAPIEIIVVNDGSTDSIPQEVLSLKHPNIRLINQPNRGKTIALQTALLAASNEFVVTIDADTQLTPSALTSLLSRFTHHQIAACSGRLLIGNQKNLLTLFQHLEYTTSFVLERPALDAINAITVAPGALTAFRKSAILQAGGFQNDTLAEDADLTLALHKNHWLIAHEPNAIAFTEAPESLKNLFRQRTRWCFGTLQALWKHRSLTLNPNYHALGLISIPSLWLFQFFLNAIIPFLDFSLLLSLLSGASSHLLLAFLLLLLVDSVIVLSALLLDRQNPALAIWVLPLRILSRPLMAAVVWHSLFRAIKGSLAGWKKFEHSSPFQIHPA